MHAQQEHIITQFQILPVNQPLMHTKVENLITQFGGLRVNQIAQPDWKAHYLQW